MLQVLRKYVLPYLLGLLTEASLRATGWTYPSLQHWTANDQNVRDAMLRNPEFHEAIKRTLLPLEMAFRDHLEIRNPTAFQQSMLGLHGKVFEGGVAWWQAMVAQVRHMEQDHSLFLIGISLFPISLPEDKAVSLMDRQLNFNGARAMVLLAYQVGGAYMGLKNDRPAVVQLFAVCLSPTFTGFQKSPVLTWHRFIKPVTLEDVESGLTKMGRTGIQRRQRKETRLVESAAEKAIALMDGGRGAAAGARAIVDEDELDEDESHLVQRSCPFLASKIYYLCTAMCPPNVISDQPGERSIVAEFRI